MATKEELILIREFYELVKIEIPDMQEQNYVSDDRRWSNPLNEKGDLIFLYLGNMESVWFRVTSGEAKSEERNKRMHNYSNRIRKEMSDQELYTLRASVAEAAGRSIGIQRKWTLSDRDQWPHVLTWIKDQFKRLKKIVVDFDNC